VNETARVAAVDPMNAAPVDPGPAFAAGEGDDPKAEHPATAASTPAAAERRTERPTDMAIRT